MVPGWSDSPLLPLTPTHVLVPKGWAKGWVSYLRILLATLPSWPVLEAREGVKGSNTGEEQRARARAACYLHSLGFGGGKANLPCKAGNSPEGVEWGLTETK